MNDLIKARPALKDELKKLMSEESRIDAELSQYFGMIAGPKSKAPTKSNLSFASLDIATTVHKLEQVGPVFEAMQQDSKKLAAQIEDCRALSERLSSIVRLLDTKQIRAQQTLACTEDIINLKECKTKIIGAIEERNLAMAVGYLRQVHEIDVVAAKSSDDYEIIKEKEQVIKSMVQQEFTSAISSSNIKSVMALCPLLQTLGLEVEARDTFLNFVESTVFAAVSADASSVEGSTDAATAYAKSLSNVFNSAYVIIQQYLPMVIQGMENSLGDVYFIRRLHKRCEQESGLVLKRYMKFRRIREVMGAIKAAGGGSAAPGPKQLPTPAEMHTIMDELALMIQYCCRYAKYIKHVCAGAESKQRHRGGQPYASVGSPIVGSPLTVPEPVVVFSGPSEFDKMVDELINKYYMEGEQWLMRLGVQRALPRVVTPSGAGADAMQLDECFFLLQKCGLRAVATNNIHAACAVLHLIADLISSDLLSQANGLASSAISQIGLVIVDHINKFKRGIASSNDEASANANSAGGVSSGFMNALSLASTTFRSGDDSTGAGAATGGIKLQEEGGFSLTGNPNSTPSDPWGVAGAIEAFNVLEMCVRYTERLSKDIHSAASMVFTAHDAHGEGSDEVKTPTGGRARPGQNALGKPSGSATPQSSEMDKIKLCREDFEAAKVSFSTVSARPSVNHLSSYASQNSVKLLVGTRILAGTAVECRQADPDRPEPDEGHLPGHHRAHRPHGRHPLRRAGRHLRRAARTEPVAAHPVPALRDAGQHLHLQPQRAQQGHDRGHAGGRLLRAAGALHHTGTTTV
jgi:hypothetical protein